MVHRTERIWLSSSYNLMQYTHLSKNLYNQANYVFKLQLNYGHFTSAFELMDILRYHPTYTALPAHTSQQIIKFLVKAWKGYIQSLKVYKQNPQKFLSVPNPPKYKAKGGFHILYFTANQVSIKNGYVHFPRRIGLKIKTRIQGKLQMARIIPKGQSFLLELIYNIIIPPLRPIQNIAAVDLGVDNLFTIVSNVTTPIIIKGTELKSYNQWYNKNKAHLTSIYALQQKSQRITYGQQLLHILDKRYKKVEDFLHKTSRLFITYCVQNNIDTIVIGYNPAWKQKVNLGKVTNQSFTNIPFLRLIHKLQYKAEDIGIRVILTEESYTSKCSFLDGETLEFHSNYLGDRIHRGLFQSKNGTLVNADCNAAGNIGRKVFPMVFTYGIVDVVTHPISLTVWSNPTRI